MSNSVLIIGNSGCGKSTSIRTLDPKETFVIQLQRKRLPFKYSREDYSEFVKVEEDKFEGNVIVTYAHNSILKTLDFVSNKYKHIKNIIIDDFQYIMAKEFMNRTAESGWQKYTDIAKHTFDVLEKCSVLRDDLDVFLLSHSEYNDGAGVWKTKTIGKMIDEKVGIEALHTIVLHALHVEDGYKFLTNRKDIYLAKSPMGMFDDEFIDNDLQFVKDKMEEYWHV